MSSGHFLCQFILCWRRKVEGGEGKMKDKKIVKYLIEDPVQHFSAIQKISSIIACFSKIDNPFFFLNSGTSWFLLTMLSLQLKRPRWEICIMEINVEVTKYTTDVFLILIHWIQNTNNDCYKYLLQRVTVFQFLQEYFLKLMIFFKLINLLISQIWLDFLWRKTAPSQKEICF